MIDVRPLTAEERPELKRMRRQELGRVSLRAQSVLLSEKPWTVPQMAELLERSRVPGRYWSERVESWGPAGLYEAERGGRPRKMPRAMDSSPVPWLEEDPPRVHERFPATLWTTPRLMLALWPRFDRGVWANTVRQALRRLGRRWGRPRPARPLNTDPQKRAKPWALVKAVVDAGPEAVVLYGDDSRGQALPRIRAMGHGLGQRLRGPTPGSNTARAMFGALNIRTGQGISRTREPMSKEDCMAFLEELLAVYPTQTVLLIVDNDSRHTAHTVDDWLRDHPRLPLHVLPKDGSHLNPVASIWLRMKTEIAANRFCGSLKIVLQTVETFFVRMTPEQALTWAAAA
jgi:transposase